MERWWLSKLILVLHITYSCAKNCASMLHPCPEGQMCIEATGKCGCYKGMVLVEDKCANPEQAGSNNGQTAIVVIFVLIAASLVSVGLFLIVRKYQLIDWVRQKLEERRSHEILYEDVMIGQDDPPLAL